mmetsp:Transcript_43539/g.64606  ORF Transcript_43539/g.64606 Transcript_43539/m.64606 type:complete len:134 (-) Transcript_43539:137-538(-)
MMAKVAESERGRAAAKWKYVYIAEAHAMDEWPLHSGRFNKGRGPVIVETQPTEALERCKLARKFAADFGMKLDDSSYEFLVDNPEEGDSFEKAYAPWPVRLYLLKGLKVEWVAHPTGCSYEKAVGELMKILEL